MPAQTDGRALDARLIARLLIDDLDLETPPLAPAQIHPVKHERPVLRLRPPRPGMDLDVAIIRIGLAVEQRLELHLSDFFNACPKRSFRFHAHRLIAFAFRHLVQFQRIGKTTRHPLETADDVIHPRALAHHLLRLFLIIPEVRVFRLCIQRLGGFQQVIPVKGTSLTNPAMLQTFLLR